MMAQVVINGLTGYLILTGNLSIGVFFSIGNFASLIFSELVVLNQNTTMIQSAKDLNNKLLVELKPVNNKENGQNNIANFAKLSIVKLKSILVMVRLFHILILQLNQAKKFFYQVTVVQEKAHYLS